MWTKKQIIDSAFTEIGLMSYTYDMEPEDIQSAIVTMDSIVSAWNLPISYHLTSSPSDADANQSTGMPIFANEPLYLALAVALCPRYGKVVNQDLKVRARASYNALLTRTARIPERQFDKTLPVGQGNKPYVGVAPQFFEPIETLTDDNGNPLL
jgi:hypothetical protein